MSNSALRVLAGAGAKDDPVYADDVFSTFLYEGNGTSQNITSGIDLDGEGGLVWTKARENTSGGATSHALIDTARGKTKWLSSDGTSAEQTNANLITAFNSNGHTVGSGGPYWTNDNGYDYVSWTFRKGEGFFDVVTYTPSGSPTNVSHNLGSTPGMIIIKNLTDSSNWAVWHRSLSSVSGGESGGSQSTLKLNTTDAISGTGYIQSPTSTQFTVSGSSETGTTGKNYIAYLFAHDAQDYGTDSDEAIIKCDTYTGNGSSTGPTIDLGFEPQWLLLKKATGSAEAWIMHDNMRGIVTGGDDPQLQADGSSAEWSGSTNIALTGTGFKLTSSSAQYNENGQDYIYMAIRRPHKPASELAATDLFKPSIYTGSGGTGTSAVIDAPTSPQAIDLAFFKSRQLNGRNWEVITRLTSSPWPNKTSTASVSPDGLHFNTTDSQADVYSFGTINDRDISVNQDSGSNINVNGESYAAWRFSRAPGFFDVVAYAGNGTAGRTVAHNLNAVPEIMLVKRTTAASTWMVYINSLGPTYYTALESGASLTTDANERWNNTSPTASVFTLGTKDEVNASNHNYVAYLFATVAGISKVDSYTGTGNDINVDCGFSSGARFVMVKRTDASGDWYVFDTARGIVAGNEGYLRLNLSNDEDSADYIDPLSSGFTVTSSAPTGMNASGGNYIFLAIA